MSEQAWFQDWFNSPFYHKLYFERDEKEATAFINRLLGYLQPAPASIMLDAGCGRGRHSRILASKGFIVTGIDLSADSIAFAKQWENKNLEFFQHDMRLPFRVNYYHYAFNFFTSFGYFHTAREHEDAIRTIASALKASGVFVIDYLNVHYAEDHLQHNEVKILNGTIYDIHRWQDDLHFFKKIIIKDASLPHPVEHTERVAKFLFGDFNDMLSFHGLQVQDAFGDYELGSYHVRNKPRMILVAKKVKE